MEYKTALAKAWLELENLMQQKKESVRVLIDEYNIDLESKKVQSLSCNVPAKEHVSILVLHYLIQKVKGLPAVTGEWLSFKQLDGGQGYYPAFKKRVIDPIVKKYGAKPEAILELTERFSAKKVQIPDISVALEIFDNVPILITLQRADEEFVPAANVLFDCNIKDIFCTEDVVVLAEFVAASI
jgi:hypothetical protein